MALGSFLGGAVLAGQLLAVFMANAGGAGLVILGVVVWCSKRETPV